MDNLPPYATTNLTQPCDGIYCLDPELSRLRTRENPSSDLVELPSSKRFAASTSTDHDDVLPSSPPDVDVLEGNKTDKDEELHHERVIKPKLRVFKRTSIAELKKSSEAIAFPASRESTLTLNNNNTNVIVTPTTSFVNSVVTSPFSTSGSDRPRQAALAVIRKAIDEGSGYVDLEELGLDSLPPEIGDLKDLVLLDPNERLKIFLAKNLLCTLSLNLFQITNLTFLSLRHNNISRIPPLIGNLQSLESLNVSYNHLQFLPAEILDLPLTHLIAQPNPLLPLPDNITHIGLPCRQQCKIYSQQRIHKIPSLTELCQRSLAMNACAEREAYKWCLSQTTNELVKRALEAYRDGFVCSHCSGTYIESAVTTIEWWSICTEPCIPLRRDFCTRRCATHAFLK